MNWTAENIPDQTGRTIIVTGANAGIGFEAARVLVAKGAKVVMACRSEARGQTALQRIKDDSPNGNVELALLDLSKLESIKAFTESFSAINTRLDVLINNAGVMIPPESKTSDGFELQIGVNFLGHFALTAQLFDLMRLTEQSRIVSLSSLAHRFGVINVESFQGTSNYKPWREYGQSKLACLMFALEMQTRFDAVEIPIRSLAAHPGGTTTDLQRHSLMSRMMRFMFMEVEQGALPTLYAATEPSIKGGEYIGPNGFFELRGYPAPAKIAIQAQDENVRNRLWESAERLTDTRFEVSTTRG